MNVKHVYDIMDYVSGQRFHPDYTRVGGLMNDLPCEKTFQKMVNNFIDIRMPKSIGDIEISAQYESHLYRSGRGHRYYFKRRCNRLVIGWATCKGIGSNSRY